MSTTTGAMTNAQRELLALLDAAERADTDAEVTLVIDSLHEMLSAAEHVAVAEAIGALQVGGDRDALRALAAALRGVIGQPGPPTSDPGV